MVKKLVEQHAILRELLSEMNAVAKQPDGTVAMSELQAAFKAALSEHLALENEEFYPRLMAAIAASEAPPEVVERIRKFIGGMKEIGKTVGGFLKKYKRDSLIRENWSDYKEDLAKCTSLLEARMESEEDGVYAEWKIYGVNFNDWHE